MDEQVKLQLDSAATVLNTLDSSQKRLADIKDTIAGTIGLAQRSASLFDDPLSSSTSTDNRYHNQYALIKAVNHAHYHFAQTRVIYEQLIALERDAERAIRLLRADWCGNMLLVAAIIAKLDGFRKQTMKMLGDTGAQTVTFTLKKYFKRVEDVKAEFEEQFWSKEPPQLFQYLLNQDYEAIVRMAKIVSRMPPEARAKISTLFDDLVQVKFAKVRNLLGDSKVGLEESLKHLDFYLSDLMMIKEGLTDRFPEDMKIVDFFLLSYHRNVSQSIQQCVVKPRLKESEDHKQLLMASGDTLELLHWTSNYHGSIEEQFAKPKEDLEPQLLDPRTEASLISAFVKESASKVSEWIQNLVRNECKGLVSRATCPQLDADDRYYSVSIIDLCRIVKQTVETAANSKDTTLVNRILSETIRSVNEVYIKNQLSMIKSEYAKIKDPSIPKKAPFFEEYLIAFGNGTVRWLSFSAEFQDELTEILDPDDQSQQQGISKQFKLANDGFLLIGKEVCDVLIDCILRTLNPVIAQLFTAHWAKKGNEVMDTLEATVCDYLQDWGQRLDPFLMKKLANDLLESLVAIYFDTLRRFTTKADTHSEHILSDLDRLRSIFSKFKEAEQRANKVTDQASKLAKAVFASSPRIFLLDALALFKTLPDLPTNGLLEQLVLKRGDTDRQEYVEAIDTLRKRHQEDKDSGSGSNSSSGPSFLRFINRTSSLQQQQHAKKKASK